MRSLLAGLAVAALACYSAVPPAEEEPMAQKTSFRVLKSGSYGRPASMDIDTRGPGPLVVVATTDEEYRRLWRDHVGDEPAPAVDFSRESAIFLLLGRRSTGGHGVTPKEVVIDDETARVIASVTSPGPDAIVTMAITAPYSVIAVSRPNLHAAEWRDGDRVVARADRKVR